MKRKLIFTSLATLLAGMMLLSACGNSKGDENSNKDAENTPWGDQSTMSEATGNQILGTGENNFVPMDEITEEDIKGKREGTFEGKDYIEYELADGSKIFSLDGEATLGEMNDAIEDANRQSRRQQ